MVRERKYVYRRTFAYNAARPFRELLRNASAAFGKELIVLAGRHQEIREAARSARRMQ